MTTTPTHSTRATTWRTLQISWRRDKPSPCTNRSSGLTRVLGPDHPTRSPYATALHAHTHLLSTTMKPSPIRAGHHRPARASLEHPTLTARNASQAHTHLLSTTISHHPVATGRSRPGPHPRQRPSHTLTASTTSAAYRSCWPASPGYHPVRAGHERPGASLGEHYPGAYNTRPNDCRLLPRGWSQTRVKITS